MNDKNRVALTKLRLQDKIYDCLFYFDSMDRPIEIHAVSPEMPTYVGNIYIARVSQVMEQLNAAFLKAGNLTFYYPIEDEEHILFTKKSGGGKKLHQGDELVVQVVRDAIKSKEIMVTTNLSFSTQRVVLTSGKRQIGISKKISGVRRNELREFLEQRMADETLSFGMVLRTAAEDCSFEEIAADMEMLISDYQTFTKSVRHKQCNQLLYHAPHPFVSVLKRYAAEEPETFVTDDKIWYDRLVSIFSGTVTEKRLRFYEDASYPMEKLYKLNKRLEDATKKNVPLPSGGFLVIEPTEALTVIDVNSGRNLKKLPPQEYALENNLQAAKQIMRQLRLRNISGIIVVDFINLKSQDAKEKLIRCMKDMAKDDYAKVNIIDYTALGLMEITREKKMPSLLQQLS